ncbi:MAG: hypothetical protein ACI4QV_03365 [Acutalibacteraceae bacterium]
MTDIDNIKTKSILKANYRRILLRMLLLLLFKSVLVLGEYIAYRYAVSKSVSDMIFAVFLILDIAFFVPTALGVLRKISLYAHKTDGFSLRYFCNLKSYFGAVFSAVFTLIFILLETMIFCLLQNVLRIYFDRAAAKAVLTAVFILSLMLLFLRFVYSMSVSLQKPPECFFSSYMKGFANTSVSRVINALKPCLTRMLLLLPVFPSVYVLPFIAVRMNIKNKADE